MDIKRKGDIIEIDGKVRVEAGPLRRSEIATEELLSDEVTAQHYQVGRTDALNNIIALGKPMDFIDWKSKERAFYVYALEEVTDTVDGKPVRNMRWVPKGVHPDEAAALSQATTLAAAAV